MRRTVIVGGSHSGVQLADTLSATDIQNHITVLTQEANPPYERPPLSKEYLGIDAPEQPRPLRSERFFAERGINWMAGETVTAVDRERKRVEVANGTAFEYSDLVFATGARNRRLNIDGHELGGVHYLRDLNDARRIKTALDQVRHVVVVGAGFIGLEFAAAARKRGVDVTVLEYAERPMSRATSEMISTYLVEHHKASGVQIRLGEGIASLRGEFGKVVAAVSTLGREFPADMVLIGVGVMPNTELAAAAGLPVEDGILVNEYLQTTDPHIWAIGDCCRFPDPLSGHKVRIESVQNATDQAKCVATNIVTSGSPQPYEATPWFWSNQGAAKLQIAGHVPMHATRVVRGDRNKAKFSVFSFCDGRLVSVESINAVSHHMAARRLIASGITLTPEQAANNTFDLKAHSRQAICT